MNISLNAILLLVIPLLAGTGVLFLYKHVGKRQLFKLDFVQFVYAFVIYPMMFVWMKSFLFFLLRSELDLNLSVGELLVVDTFFSTLGLFIFAFVIIHALTKSFNVRYYRDPLYDVFEHSEYFHLWLSHVGMYTGIIGIMSLLSLANVLVPFEVVADKWMFYVVVGSGTVAGSLVFSAVWLSDPEEENFMRLMKLVFGLFFLIHVAVYFVMEPKFGMEYSAFWLVFMALLTAVGLGFLFHRSKRAVKAMEKFKHSMWEKKLKLKKK